MIGNVPERPFEETTVKVAVAAVALVVLFLGYKAATEDDYEPNGRRRRRRR